MNALHGNECMNECDGWMSLFQMEGYVNEVLWRILTCGANHGTGGHTATAGINLPALRKALRLSPVVLLTS